MTHGGGDADGATLAGGPTAGDEAIVRRLRSVQGHVRGIERMVSEGAYCIDVLHQVGAVQKALERIGEEVLDRHLHSCAVEAIRGEDPAERERVIGEILDVWRRARKG